MSVSISESATSMNEGGTITFTVTATGYADNSNLYFSTLEKSGSIAAAEFDDNTLVGVCTITSETSSFTRTVVSDRNTEGSEIFQIEIREGSSTGTVLAISNEITILDTSVNIGHRASGKTFGPVQVNRDDGNTSNTSDWYSICDLETLPEGSKIAVFIDPSGSMSQYTVQASYNLLLEKLAAKNITVITVTDTDNDWITPFLGDLS